MSGPPPDAVINTSDITFTHLRTKWRNAEFSGGSDPGTSNISLSGFRGATFTNTVTTVPNSGQISIKDHFKGNTFGTSGGGKPPP